MPLLKRFSDKEMMDNIINIWLKIGQQPTFKQMQTPLSEISGATYRQRYNTWNIAIDNAISYAKQNNVSIPIYKINQFKTEETKKGLLVTQYLLKKPLSELPMVINNNIIWAYTFNFFTKSQVYLPDNIKEIFPLILFISEYYNIKNITINDINIILNNKDIMNERLIDTISTLTPREQRACYIYFQFTKDIYHQILQNISTLKIKYALEEGDFDDTEEI